MSVPRKSGWLQTAWRAATNRKQIKRRCTSRSWTRHSQQHQYLHSSTSSCSSRLPIQSTTSYGTYNVTLSTSTLFAARRLPAGLQCPQCRPRHQSLPYVNILWWFNDLTLVRYQIFYITLHIAQCIQGSWAIAEMTARCALCIWAPWKFSGVPDNEHGYFSRNF